VFAGSVFAGSVFAGSVFSAAAMKKGDSNGIAFSLQFGAQALTDAQ
jgi:hypothetical protein